MTDRTHQTSNLYALLIGIDCYLPNKLPNGSSYKNLGGCVRDILHIEAYLKDFQKVPENQILKLTASPSTEDDKKALESHDKLPTRNNTIAAFKKLGEMAPAQSQVYIHYSGHGGRAKTVFPDIKGAGEIDEGLVPTDIGTSEGQYLRDLDLAFLLKELADKELVVTLVLDCCHSGGATRGVAAVRGMNVVDDKPLEPSFLPVAEPGVLATLWHSLTGAATRGLKASGVPESQDYVLLAACRQTEVAHEFPFDGGTQSNGALTYWLLDTLKQPFPGQTYQDLFARINAKIHSQFSDQTPILLGEGSRQIFGTELGAAVFAVDVMQVEPDEQGKPQTILAIGQANGVSKGAEFAIYPRGTTDLTRKEHRMAIATIIERGSSQSKCTLTPTIGTTRQVEPGDRAVQTSASVNLIRSVSLWHQPAATPAELAASLPPNTLRPEIFQCQEAALEAIGKALSDNGWLELVTDNSGSDYIVTINNVGEYEIAGSSGIPFKNISPAAKITDFDAPARVAKRLVHLAKYQATLELDNVDADSPLSGKLAVEWLGTSGTYGTGDPMPKKDRLTQFTDPNHPTVKVGDYVFLCIRNDSKQVLNVAALCFDAEWAIDLILPTNELFLTLEPRQEKILPLQPTLDGQDNSVENIVKVFGTLDAVNYQVLTLPSLDEPLPFGRGTRSGNSLVALLGAIDEERPKTRKLTVAASPSTEWTTKQVILTIEKESN